MQISGLAIGQYYPGSSFIHQLDPRSKIVAVFVYVIVLFLVKSFVGLALMGAALVLGVAVARIPPLWLYRGIKPVLLLVIVTFFFHLFWGSGDELGHIGPLVLYQQGARDGGFLAFRLILLVLSSSLLTFTTAPVLLNDALGKMMAPLKKVKFPAGELALMITIALRFIPTMLLELDRITKAQTARGASFGRGGFVRRARSFLPVLVPLFVLSFRHADGLALAMESRCWRGGKGRMVRRRLQLGWRDAVFGLMMLLLAGASVLAGRVIG